MNPRDAFWERVNRRASGLTPPQARAFFAGVDALRERLSGAQLEALIAVGDVDGVIRLALSDENLNAAFAKYRARMQVTTRDAVGYFGRDLGIGFDLLNPVMVDAIRGLDTRMMQTLKADIREVARATIQRGLERGVGPRTTARELRAVVGLAPNQETAVDNFRRALQGDASAGSPLDRALRDRRFDRVVRRGNLTPEQIDRMTDAYRRRMLAFNAETNARTATLDAMKLGQDLAWREARDAGLIPDGALRKQWKGVLDVREREEHVEMEGETVPFDQPYSNGEMIPGESTFNCRCLSIVYVERAA